MNFANTRPGDPAQLDEPPLTRSAHFADPFPDSEWGPAVKLYHLTLGEIWQRIAYGAIAGFSVASALFIVYVNSGAIK